MARKYGIKWWQMEREGQEESQVGVPERPGGRRRIPLAPVVFAACLLIYLILFLAVPVGKGLKTRTMGDEPHYLVVTESILKDGDLSLLNNYEARDYQKSGYYEKYVLTPHVVFGRNNRVVPVGQVLLSLVILPGFALAGWRGAGITMILFMSASAVFVFLILSRFVSARMSALVTLFFFLTYPLLLYSHLIYPEVPALLLVSAGTWSALKAMDGKGDSYLLLAGFCAALLPQLHVKFLTLTLGLTLLAVLAAWRRPRGLALYFLPLAASVVVLVLLTRHMYGPNLIRGLTVVGGKKGFWGKDSPWGVFGLYLDRSWGLLPFAPLYLALFSGLPLPGKRPELRAWWVFIPVTILVQTVVSGCFREWHGGAAPVPRYLVTLIPLFIICAAVTISGARHLYTRVVIGALAVFQLVLTVLARITPAATLGLPTEKNELYHYFLGDWLASRLERVFPLLHPVSPRSIVLVFLWVAFIAAIIYCRRLYLDSLPGEALSGRRASFS